VRRSIARWAINRQLSSEIQLLRFHRVGASSLQVARNSPNRRVWASCSRRGELQGESLAALAVTLKLTNLPLPNGRDDGPMIRIVDPGLPKRHVAEMPHVRLPCHAIILLGLMPVSPPLLLPSPSHPSSLSSTTSLDLFAAHVDEVYFVGEIHDDLLPLGLWGPEVKIQVP
jgi:hypothetical protein